MAPVDGTSIGGGYQSNVDILRSEIAAAEERKRKAQTQMITNNPKDEYGFGKFVSDAVRVALPALIGYKVGGGWEGAAAGAKAGVASINEAEKKAAVKDAEADALLKLEADSADSELDRKTKMSDQLLMAGIKEESQQDAYAPGGYRYNYEQMKQALGIGAAASKERARLNVQKEFGVLGGGENIPIPPSVVAADKVSLAEIKVSPEELAGLDELARTRPKDYQSAIAQIRLRQNQQFQIGGGSSDKPVSDATAIGIGKRISGVKQLDNLIGMVQGPNVNPSELSLLSREYGQTLKNYMADNKVDLNTAIKSNPGLIDNIIQRNAARINPNSETAQVFKESKRIANETALARNGVATEQDVGREIEQLVIDGLENVPVYVQRLTRIRGGLDRQIRLETEALKHKKPSDLAAFAARELGESPSMATQEDIIGGDKEKEKEAYKADYLKRKYGTN